MSPEQPQRQARAPGLPGIPHPCSMRSPPTLLCVLWASWPRRPRDSCALSPSGTLGPQRSRLVPRGTAAGSLPDPATHSPFGSIPTNLSHSRTCQAISWNLGGGSSQNLPVAQGRAESAAVGSMVGPSGQQESECEEACSSRKQIPLLLAIGSPRQAAGVRFLWEILGPPLPAPRLTALLCGQPCPFSKPGLEGIGKETRRWAQ